MANYINSAGLVLDIIGAIIILNYGLPPKVDPEGKIYRVTRGVDEEEVKLGKKYKLYSKVEVGLIIIGFILQIISNHLPSIY